MFDDLINDLKRSQREFADNKQECLENIGQALKANTESFTPVDTGKLKKSHELSITNDSVELTNKQDYASHVNSGHATRGGGFVSGRHMLEKGLSKTHITVTQEVNKLLRKTFK